MSFEPPFSVADRWQGPWNPLEFERWALGLRRSLLPRPVDLGIVFATPEYVDAAGELIDVLRSSVGVETLVGCVASGVIANAREFEREGSIALGLYCLPGARLHDFGFSGQMALEAIEEDEPGYWRKRFEPGSEGISGWLVFAEPLHFDIEKWLESWQRDFPGKPVFGGLSHFESRQERSLVIWNDTAMGDGAVAVGVAGGVSLTGLTAQGCTPVGESWTITKAKGNVLERIGNRPAFQILDQTYSGMTEELRVRSKGNLFIGLAVDEYQSEFKRGDFVVRNLLAADPGTGVLAVGAYPRVGQTLQFQIRDGEGASRELSELIEQFKDGRAGKRVYGACLNDCAGRGRGMFGGPNHDASLVYRYVQPQGMVGFFGNGEFGPVGSRNFVHGYTSTLAMFCEA